MKDLLEAVNLYFEGIHECDVFKLKEVFHPESSLFDADNGNIFVETIDAFLEDVSTRTSPASVGQVMKSEVLMIDYLSPISSTVKIRIQTHKNVFVDHLAFIKGQNGWKIVSKVWHLEKEEKE
ncbi:nuclear transport factor 2 family protein [Amylibacter sp.]|nr:nuclear transport factor 2 family protein [Amylibacter sp.]